MKRFYNNTLIGGAFSKALRVVALLCVLLGFSSSAWGAYYLHYNNTGSHTKDIGASDLKWTDGVEPVDNVCTWTITTSVWDNYVYIMSSKANKTVLDIEKATTDNKSSNIDFANKSEHQGNYLFYFKQKSAKQITITIIYNLSTKVITLSDGGADICTPSVSMVSAIFNGTQIEMKGNVTKSCGSAYRGFEYSTDGNNWMSTGGGNSASTGEYTGNWTPTKKGTTYFIRASYGNSKSSNTISVKIPAEGSGEADCSGVVYLTPGVWTADNAWFAVYYWKGSGGEGNEGWVEMVKTNCEGDLYYAVIPEGYDNVIFARMKNTTPNTKDSYEFSNDVWNQTENLTIQQEEKCFQITAWNNVGTWTTTDCTEGCIVAGSGDLLLSSKPIVNKQNKVATVSAYLARNAGCKNITEYGFVYCTSANEEECTPDAANSVKVIREGSLIRGQEYSMNIPNLDDGLTYYYRAYILADDTPILSDEIRSFATDPCIPQECCGDNTIIYTIDATFSKDNLCKLQFRNLQTAIDHLKETSELESDNKFKYVTKSGDSYNLNQPVEMRVAYYDDTPDDPTLAYAYRGTTNYGMTAGDVAPVNVNLIQDFNKNATNRANTLTIKAGTSTAKPWVHHIVVRNSRNIVLDSLCIYSDPTGLADNAMEFDLNSTWWDGIGGPNAKDDNGGSSRYIPILEDANILVQNCMIGSAGFTGVHFSGYDGITFKNNDFEAQYSQAESDDTSYRTVINYGASAKFISCKNIKFIQNNFRGSHPTLMWLQECSNVLVMNNVFWNTNTLQPSNTNLQRSAALRLVHQFNKQGKPNVSNVSAFYNTFYLAESEKTKDNARYDFLYFSNTVDNASGSSSSNFDLATIKFQYNNCYSYDKKVLGKSNGTRNLCNNDKGTCADVNEPFLGINLSNSDNFCPNNFWSEYDQIEYKKLAENEKASYVSAFAFGCADNEFINVKSQVCSTTASGPASLIVKGKGMDYGVKPDISTTGITLEPNEHFADRYIIGARPAKGEKWTYGAYQSKDEIPTQTIYWVGKTSDWDDRNNWEYETEVAGQIVRQRVSCVNTFSEDLKVVIEEIGTVEIQGGRKWPKVPASFTENRTNSDYGEHVSAGLGTIDNPTKFADHIEVEYGAGIIGVENLNKAGDQLRYTSAATNLVAPRSQWLLVGPVIKPFNEETKDIEDDVRNIVSNDYFLNHFPAVYMKGAYLTKDNEGNALAKWDASFPDLNKAVVQKSAYAIELPDEYGTEKNTAGYYNATFGTSYDPTEAHPYRFNGRFYNEDSELIYTGLTENEPVLLNNTYPANIDADALNTSGKGTVQLYNYSTNAFDAAPSVGTAILSQHAFVFTPAKDGTLVIDNTEWFLNTSTRHRSSTIVNPNCRVEVRNTKYNTASNVVVMVDEFKDDEADYSVDAPKIYNGMEKSLPDMYVMRYDKTWSGIRVPSMEEAIPLGIRINRKNTPVEFNLVSKEELGDIILEDRGEGKFYNLSEGEKCTVSDLQKGECIGRFFLYLSEPNMEEDDDNVTTEVEEEVSSENGIIIMSKENGVVVSCSSDIELKTIYINDMSGKTAMFNVSGQYAEIELPVAQGVYTVNVIGDTATKTGKVILK